VGINEIQEKYTAGIYKDIHRIRSAEMHIDMGLCPRESLYPILRVFFLNCPPMPAMYLVIHRELSLLLYPIYFKHFILFWFLKLFG